jgi:hypothetical protein
MVAKKAQKSNKMGRRFQISDVVSTKGDIIVDKKTEIKMKKKAASMVLATDTTPKDILDFINEVKAENDSFDNSERFRGRKEDAKYVLPHIIAPMEEHGLRINPTTGRAEKSGKEFRDIGMAMWHDILSFGRATMDELTKRYRGLNKNLVQIMLNSMLEKHYLKKYKERDGTKTLEVITEDEYTKWNKERGIKELDDKFKDVNIEDGIPAPPIEELEVISQWEVISAEEAEKRYGAKLVGRKQSD